MTKEKSRLRSMTISPAAPSSKFAHIVFWLDDLLLDRIPMNFAALLE